MCDIKGCTSVGCARADLKSICKPEHAGYIDNILSSTFAVYINQYIKNNTQVKGDTETEGGEVCPISTTGHCKFYAYIHDRNGEVAAEYCANELNKNDSEGNCTKELCPLSEPEFTRWDIVPKDALVYVRDTDNDEKILRHFYSRGDDYARVYDDGKSSITSNGQISTWKNCELASDIDSNDSYTAWFGGECPVDEDTIVKVIHKSGNVYIENAKNFRWKHNDIDSDIVLYTVIK